MRFPAPLLAAAGLLLAPLFLPAPPAFAQANAADPALVEDAAQLIPAEAGVVIRIADPDRAFTHVQSFAEEAAPQFAGFVRQGRAMLGVGVQNPTLSGINLKAPWYLVMMPKADAPPATVYLLPVENARAAEESVGPNFQFKTLGTYLAYTEADGVLDSFKPGSGAMEQMPKGTVELAQNSDITVYVNIPKLREVYSDQIEEGLTKFEEQMASQAASPEAAAGQKQFLKLAKGLLDDSTGLALGLNASADKLSITKLFTVASGSETAKLLATQKAAPFDVLNRLPEGLDGYLAAEGDFAPLVEGLAKFSGSENDAAKDLMSTLAKAGMTASAGGFMLGGGDDPLLSGVQVTSLKDMAKAKAAVQKYMTEADGKEENGVKTSVEQTGTVEVEGMTMTVYSTSLEATGTNPQAQTGVNFFNSMFGGSLDQKIGYTNEALVQITAGDDAFAEEVVSHYNGDSGHTNEPLDAARKMLPKTGNLFGAIDLAAVVQSGLAAAIESGQVPLPLDAATIRGVDVETSYAAFVTTTGRNSVKVEAVLPAAQVRNIVDLGSAVQGGGQGF